MKHLLLVALSLLTVQAFAQVEIAIGDTSSASRSTRAALRVNASGIPILKVGTQNSKRIALLSDVVAAAGGGVQQVNGISPSSGNVTLTTSNITEGSNQYFTQARSRGAVSVTAPLVYNASTGAFSFSGSKSDVGLANVDNTSDANKPVSSATQTALNAKEPTIATGSTAQYIRGDKSLATLDKTAVGLANVDNVSDANKPVSSATQTALNGKANVATTIAGYGITDAYPYQSVATYAAMNALSFSANTARQVLVANDEQYGDTQSWYMVWADNGGTMHAKRITTITEK